MRADLVSECVKRDSQSSNPRDLAQHMAARNLFRITMRLSVDRCPDNAILTTLSAALMQPRPSLVRSLFACRMFRIQCIARVMRRPIPEVVATARRLCLGLQAKSDSRSHGGCANPDLDSITVDVVIVYSWSSARREVCPSCLSSLKSMRLRVP
jgi:hypothetical protein